MSQTHVMNNQHSNHIELGTKDGGQRPLHWWQTTLAFGIPSLVMVISIHGVIPLLQRIGLTPFESMVVSYSVPMALMLTAALVIYHEVDGYPLTWPAFSQHFRYPRITLKAILQGLGLFAAIMVGYGLLNGLATMVTQGWMPIPNYLPALLDPRVALTTAVLDNMVGGHISGNWSVVILYFIMFFFNIVGEELWWRGYLLPRQEATYGRYAWVWHGLLWTAFHVHKWWDLIGLLAVCLPIAYVSQRTKNNWPAFIAHALFNVLGWLLMIVAVMS